MSLLQHQQQQHYGDSRFDAMLLPILACFTILVLSLVNLCWLGARMIIVFIEQGKAWGRKRLGRLLPTYVGLCSTLPHVLVLATFAVACAPLALVGRAHPGAASTHATLGWLWLCWSSYVAPLHVLTLCAARSDLLWRRRTRSAVLRCAPAACWLLGACLAVAARRRAGCASYEFGTRTYTYGCVVAAATTTTTTTTTTVDNDDHELFRKNRVDEVVVGSGNALFGKDSVAEASSSGNAPFGTDTVTKEASSGNALFGKDSVAEASSSGNAPFGTDTVTKEASSGNALFGTDGVAEVASSANALFETESVAKVASSDNAPSFGVARASPSSGNAPLGMDVSAYSENALSGANKIATIKIAPSRTVKIDSSETPPFSTETAASSRNGPSAMAIRDNSGKAPVVIMDSSENAPPDKRTAATGSENASFGATTAASEGNVPRYAYGVSDRQKNDDEGESSGAVPPLRDAQWPGRTLAVLSCSFRAVVLCAGLIFLSRKFWRQHEIVAPERPVQQSHHHHYDSASKDVRRAWHRSLLWQWCLCVADTLVAAALDLYVVPAAMMGSTVDIQDTIHDRITVSSGTADRSNDTIALLGLFGTTARIGYCAASAYVHVTAFSALIRYMYRREMQKLYGSSLMRFKIMSTSRRSFAAAASSRSFHESCASFRRMSQSRHRRSVVVPTTMSSIDPTAEIVFPGTNRPSGSIVPNSPTTQIVFAGTTNRSSGNIVPSSPTTEIVFSRMNNRSSENTVPIISPTTEFVFAGTNRPSGNIVPISPATEIVFGQKNCPSRSIVPISHATEVLFVGTTNRPGSIVPPPSNNGIGASLKIGDYDDNDSRATRVTRILTPACAARQWSIVNDDDDDDEDDETDFWMTQCSSTISTTRASRRIPVLQVEFYGGCPADDMSLCNYNCGSDESLQERVQKSFRYQMHDESGLPGENCSEIVDDLSTCDDEYNLHGRGEIVLNAGKLIRQYVA